MTESEALTLMVGKPETNLCGANRGCSFLFI